MTRTATLLLTCGGTFAARTAAWVARRRPTDQVLLGGNRFSDADLALLPAQARIEPLAADDIGAIEALIRRHDVTRIISLSGVDEPRDGSLSMLEAVSRYQVPFAALIDLCVHAWIDRQAPIPHRLMLATPAAIFGLGVDDGFPIHENSPLAPGNPQMAALSAMALALHAAHTRYGLDTSAAYIGNLIGASEGIDPAARIVHCILSGKRVPVYGDGEQLIDLLSADEAACALAAALDVAEAGSVHGFTGASVSALSLAGLVCQAIDAAFLADATLAQQYPYSPMAHGQRAAELVTRVADRRQATRPSLFAFGGLHLLGDRNPEALSRSVASLVDAIVHRPALAGDVRIQGRISA